MIGDLKSDGHKNDTWVRFFVCLASYLEEPTNDDTATQLKRLARALDVRRETSLLPGRHVFSVDLTEFLDLLDKKDGFVWLALLKKSAKAHSSDAISRWGMDIDEKLYSLSPFDGKIIISCQYRNGGACEIACLSQDLVDDLMRKNGLSTDCGGEYALIFDKEALSSVEIMKSE